MPVNSPARGKLYIKTHGCQMNEYDSAKMADVLAAEHGLELTAELVGHHPAAADHVLSRVVGVLPQHPVVRVRLHPEVAADAGVLAEHGVAVVADPQLGRGDALVECDEHVVDLRVDHALARLREALA